MSKEQKNASGQDDGGHRSKITVKYSKIEAIDRLYDLEKQAKADDTNLFGLYQSVPDCWCHFILDDRGRPYHLAMRVLAEIIFRHRPREDKTSRDGNVVIQLVKNFRDKVYQFNRHEFARRWNVSPDAVSDALGVLDKLGVILRDHEDKDINCRGFRNLTFVTPKLDKLLELSKEALKKNLGIESEQEPVNDSINTERHNAGSVAEDAKNPINTESHDGGHVTGIKGGTSPASNRDVTGIKPPHGPVHASLSRRSSEKPSASVSGSAPPNPLPEANINNNTSAPPAAPAARARDDVVDDSCNSDQGAAPPETPADPNTSNSSSKNKERLDYIENELKHRFRQFHQDHRQLEIPDGFMEKVIPFCKPRGWLPVDLVHIISFSWLQAAFYRQKRDSKFDGALYSKLCRDNLNNFFKMDKTNTRYIEVIASVKELNYEPGQITPHEDRDWWEEELEKYDIIRDDSKYYDQAGRHLFDPWDSGTTWAGIYSVFEDWLRWNKPDRQPEEKWLKTVVERYHRDKKLEKNMRHSDFERCEQILIKRELIPGDPQKCDVRWR